MTAEAHARCVAAGHHICQQPSGRVCIEPGCFGLAGTWWGPYWCPEHDRERLDRISGQLEAIAADLVWPDVERDQCVSCGEAGAELNECNHSWTHDACDWCGAEFGEDSVSPDVEPGQ